MRVGISEIVASRFEWDAIRCASGSASDIPGIFGRLVQIEAPSQIVKCDLSPYIAVQGNLFQAALPVAEMIMAALVQGVSRAAQDELLNQLLTTVVGESHWSEVELGNGDIAGACQRIAREGIWTLYREYQGGHALLARSILIEIDDDNERFEYFDSKFRSRIRR